MIQLIKVYIQITEYADLNESMVWYQEVQEVFHSCGATFSLRLYNFTLFISTGLKESGPDAVLGFTLVSSLLTDVSSHKPGNVRRQDVAQYKKLLMNRGPTGAARSVFEPELL